MRILGIVVLLVGIIMTTLTGFTIVTKKKVVDLGPVEVNKEERTPVYWSPVTGGLLIVAGVVFVLADRKKKL